MGRRKHDIERYLRGEMTPRERHALEKEALQDPFLSEALEGASQAGSETFLFDLKELHNTVHQRVHARRPKTISLWRWSLGIAAGLMLLAVASVYIIGNINNRQQEKNLASSEEAAPKQAPQDSPGKAQADSVINEPSRPAIALNKPSQPAQTEKKPTPGTARPAQPANPVADASRDDRSAGTQVERVAQAEAVETEDQRIVEADLSEVPREIESRTRTEAETADKKKAQSLARAAETRREAAAPAPRTVHGKVISTEDGMPLPGVNVLVKGTNISTVTDEVGNYQVALNDARQTLVFSFIGLKDVEVRAENNREINIQMTPNYAELSEVVVVGYGAGTPGVNNTEQLAEPQGGRNAFEKYLEEKMHYPEQALENKVEGRVTVQFTVDANGQLGEFKVIKGIGYGCDDEVIRLIREGPAWSPSKRNDQPVKDKVKVRLKFDIPN